MKKYITIIVAAALLLTGCAAGDPSAAPQESQVSASKVSTAESAAATGEAASTGTPLTAADILDGSYEIAVDSSSTMFNITKCTLNVSDGSMTAVMTMHGKGYLYLFMGKGNDAVESGHIPFVEDADGNHTFTVPVPALDTPVDCAAFSKNKEKWYDRTLVFRADSLPADALADGVMTTAESLSLADGTYTADVTLSGGSGRASVESPAALTVSGGKVTAKIIWSSKNYDYMKVNDEKYDAVIENEHSTFEIPVAGFDWAMPVVADTTAMSEPHEIEYTLRFDSASIAPAAK